MFRESMQRDLIRIFGITRIIFDSFTLGKEMEALFVNLDQVKTNFGGLGKKFFRINGTVEICSTTLEDEWLAERLSLAEKGGFTFSTLSTPLKYTYNNNDFFKTSIRFEYTLSEEFNEDRTEINSIEWSADYV